jgi:putative sigma-54 modulation protein
VRGKDLHAACIDGDMYAAIDGLADKLDRQVLKHKEQLRKHRADTNSANLPAVGPAEGSG